MKTSSFGARGDRSRPPKEGSPVGASGSVPAPSPGADFSSPTSPSPISPTPRISVHRCFRSVEFDGSSRCAPGSAGSMEPPEVSHTLRRCCRHLGDDLSALPRRAPPSLGLLRVHPQPTLADTRVGVTRGECLGRGGLLHRFGVLRLGEIVLAREVVLPERLGLDGCGRVLAARGDPQAGHAPIELELIDGRGGGGRCLLARGRPFRPVVVVVVVEAYFPLDGVTVVVVAVERERGFTSLHAGGGGYRHGLRRRHGAPRVVCGRDARSRVRRGVTYRRRRR